MLTQIQYVSLATQVEQVTRPEHSLLLHYPKIGVFDTRPNKIAFLAYHSQENDSGTEGEAYLVKLISRDQNIEVDVVESYILKTNIRSGNVNPIIRVHFKVLSSEFFLTEELTTMDMRKLLTNKVVGLL